MFVCLLSCDNALLVYFWRCCGRITLILMMHVAFDDSKSVLESEQVEKSTYNAFNV